MESFAASTALTMGDPVDLTKFHMYHVLRKSSLSQMQSRINGMVFRNTWGVSWGFPANYARIGSSSNSFAGDIAEVIIFGNSLSEEERRVVGAYLNQRYKLHEALPGVPVWAPPKALSSTQISLNWMAPLQSTAVFYTLERKSGVDAFSAITTLNSNLSYLDTGLSPSTTYTYRIKAVNYVGEASYSAETSETTLALGATDLPIPSVGWYKADGGNAPGPVNYWKRYLSESGAAQTVEARQPALQENVVNEKPALYFNENNSAIFFGNIYNGATQGEAIVYLKVSDATPPGSRVLWRFGRYGSSLVSSQYPDSSGRIQDAFGRSSKFNSNTPPIPIDQFHIYDVLSASSNWQNRFNGTLDGSTTSNTVSFSTNCSLGVEDGGSFDGYICELLMYNSTLSSTQRTVVYDYLNSKYGILDSDSDGLSDNWELRYFGNLGASAAEDADNDGLTNLEEFQLASPGTASYPNPASADTDGDGLRDWREYVLGLSIGNPDTDQDGMSDGYEVQFGFSALYDDASADIDADGQTNLEEFQAFATTVYVLNPDLGDANGDGVDDAVAYRMGLGLTDDPDGDGLTNLQEQNLGTNGYRSDTDGDGHGDNVDDYPLDATRWTKPASNPFDLFPPIITLDEPSTGVILP